MLGTKGCGEGIDCLLVALPVEPEESCAVDPVLVLLHIVLYLLEVLQADAPCLVGGTL